MNIVNRRGPRTVPWEHIDIIGSNQEVQLGSIIFWILYLRKLLILDNELMSKFSVFSFFRRMSCEIESKAFERSRNAEQTTSLSLTFFHMFSVAYKSASVVEKLLQKPNCVLLNNLCCERYSDICS